MERVSWRGGTRWWTWTDGEQPSEAFGKDVEQIVKASVWWEIRAKKGKTSWKKMKKWRMERNDKENLGEKLAIFLEFGEIFGENRGKF